MRRKGEAQPSYTHDASQLNLAASDGFGRGSAGACLPWRQSMAAENRFGGNCRRRREDRQT